LLDPCVGSSSPTFPDRCHGALNAQGLCAPIADRCERHITAQYIPDGQFYRALLQGDEVAEFDLTLFGGSTYRVAACSGDFGRVAPVQSVLDKDRNVLFTNKEHSSTHPTGTWPSPTPLMSLWRLPWILPKQAVAVP
jgi:hypothetical protein